MRILLFLSVLIAIASLAFPVALLAQAPSGGSSSGATLDIPAILNRIQKWLFGFLLAVAALIVIYAAYLRLAGSGDAENVQTSNRAIFYAVVAIAIAALSKVIVAIVQALVKR